jgi:glutamate-1-semialdehyde 2,1-aminomutase
MKCVALVQARMGSTRFPNKVMQPCFNGKPLIGVLFERLIRSKLIDEIVLATSEQENNKQLSAYVEQMGYRVYAGSESDVLGRYYDAAQMTNADIIVRITGDCPLVDPELVDKVIQAFKDNNSCDYASNINPPSYPDGLDIEVFSMKALTKAYQEATTKFEREHVTPYLRESAAFKRINMSNDMDYSSYRWTVDEPEDLIVIDKVIEHFYPELHFEWKEVINLRESKPELFEINKHIMRNEGATMGAGQKLWKRAKKVIPGGNMLLSKRAEMFLPDQWPAYFSKSKGSKVWDMDGLEYTDMSLMGIGTNTLGYGNDEVDAAVMETLRKGNMSTLNCPEEVFLAEKLVELNPWADMVRFARSGGEANAIAIRIARAASARDKVAICGYHGWHDWYLSANHNDGDQLSGHLIPGLEPAGVPKDLKNTVLPFHYNKIEELEMIVAAHDIGVIKMEVVRNFGPEDNFLQKVRALADSKNIVLVFDECTSGFRETYGGIYQKYGVEPDIAMYGKAIGNGYALNAVVGRRSVMEAAQKTFISSTFWTERIGPTAALATLKVMKELKSWELITETGKKMQQGWKQLATANNIKIQVSGIPALSTYSFDHENTLAFKTLVTQEMLKKGYLASTNFYASTAHTDAQLQKYFESLDSVFGLVSKCINEREDIHKLLEGPVCHSGFKRLN